MNTKIKKSGIHGRGLFAVSNFNKGDVVLTWKDTREITEAEFLALPPEERHFIDIQDKKIFLIGVPERYVNHSCNPNMISGGRSDIAGRDIMSGEELTIDYANFFISIGSFTCSCGSSKCRGLIKGKSSDRKSGPTPSNPS